MNTFRSTERTITLLALNKTKPRSNYVASRKLTNKTPKAHVSYISSRYTPRIKLYNGLASSIQDRAPLSSTENKLPTLQQTLQVSLLNPNKPGPAGLEQLVMPPIVPLTAPRFPTKQDIPSVTKVLQATMPAASKFLLEKWKESMIKKLGAAGFAKYQADTFERGRALHALLATQLLGKGEPTAGKAELSTEVVSNLWKSIQNVVRDKISNVRLVEHIVTHPTMNYRGIVDCVAFYENELVVIDFKTAEKPKKTVESLFDNPLQVTAYCGAINNDSSIPSHVIDRNISSGVVIVAYIDGSEATTYHLECEKVSHNYWKQWIERLDQYSRMEELNKKKTITVKKS